MVCNFKMLTARYIFYPLHFKRPAGTSRGVLHHKKSWILQIWDDINPEIQGIGEVSTIQGLSIDNENEIPNALDELCRDINTSEDWSLTKADSFPAIKFGLETALADLRNKGKQIFVQNDFTKGIYGIPINGLIWMGNSDFMITQIREKIEQGFNCIKIKVGAINFEEEIGLLKFIRKQFNEKFIEIRLDANGAFAPQGALQKLDKLSAFGIHSIEQPIKAGQPAAMADICSQSPIPIALDEELIGKKPDEITATLEQIKPQYIILKPSLLGGFATADHWISAAEQRHIGWWATSALESNIGLNAIAQWVSEKKTILPQGLGTGQLYINNIASPLEIKKAALFHNPAGSWHKVFGE